MFLSRYIVEVPYEDGYTIVFSTLNGATMAIKTDLMQRIRAEGLSVLADLPEGDAEFFRSRFATPDSDAEKHELNSRLNAIKNDRSLFSMTVALTMDCTLRCVYCYQQGVRSRTRLPSGFVPSLIDLARKRIETGARRVRLHLYGGEPLLEAEAGLELLRGINRVCKEHEAQLGASITTNGVYLHRGLAEQLVDAGLGIAQVSIDGPRDIHDARRMSITGHGTYDIIMRNIQDVADILPVVIRVNVDRHNVQYIPLFMDELISRGLQDSVRLNIELVSPIWDSVPHCEQHTYKAPEEMVDMLWLWEEQEKRGIPVFGIMPIEGACENLAANSITIDPEGRIFMCPGFLGMDDFVVGSISEDLLHERLSSLISAEPWKDCLDCPYCPVCRGGCRMCSYVTTRDYEGAYCKRSFFDRAYPIFLKAKYDSMARSLLSLEGARATC
jgi:uncharacterized protein